MLRGDDVAELQRRLGAPRLRRRPGRRHLRPATGARPRRLPAQRRPDPRRRLRLRDDRTPCSALGRPRGAGRRSPPCARREQLRRAPRTLAGRRIVVGELGGLGIAAPARWPRPCARPAPRSMAARRARRLGAGRRRPTASAPTSTSGWPSTDEAVHASPTTPCPASSRSAGGAWPQLAPRARWPPLLAATGDAPARHAPAGPAGDPDAGGARASSARYATWFARRRQWYRGRGRRHAAGSRRPTCDSPSRDTALIHRVGPRMCGNRPCRARRAPRPVDQPNAPPDALDVEPQLSARFSVAPAPRSSAGRCARGPRGWRTR